jgi:hypothetical protein
MRSIIYKTLKTAREKDIAVNRKRISYLWKVTQYLFVKKYSPLLITSI